MAKGIETRREATQGALGQPSATEQAGGVSADASALVSARQGEAAAAPAVEQADAESPAAAAAAAAIGGSSLPATARRTETAASSRTEPVSSTRQADARSSVGTVATGTAGDRQQAAASPQQAGTMQAAAAQQGADNRPKIDLDTEVRLNMLNGRLSVARPEPSSSKPLTGNDFRNDLAPEERPDTRAEMTEIRPGVPEADPVKKKISEEASDLEERRQRTLRQQGLREIRREGIVEKPEAPRTLSRSNRTFTKIKNIIKDKIDTSIKHATKYTGMSFYETIFSKPDLMPHCVSIGTENLIESLREPNSGLLQLVNEKMLEARPDERPLTLEECLEDISILVNEINSLNIEVVVEKTPVNINHSIQVRTLRVHHGRGIGLHPTQTKAYNADYDGDPAVINLDQTQLLRYAKAMDRLISTDGKPLIDPDFFPLESIEADQRDTLIESLRKEHLSWAPELADMIVDAYMGACNEGDWVGFLRRIDELAEYESKRGMRDRSEYASAILKSMYDFSIYLRGYRIGQKLDNENRESSNYTPPDGNTHPFVMDLVNLTDEIIAGRQCPSLVEFTRFYHRFYGDIKDSEGRAKNVPFRLLADYAKAINRTDLITVGSDLFGFRIERADGKMFMVDAKPGEEAMISIHDLWQFTCVAGLTKQISGRCYMGSRELAVSTQVRSVVLEKCPIIEWQSDEEFNQWINRFISVYNDNIRILNMAQAGWRGGMRPHREKSTLRFDGIKEPSDLADALVKVYGKMTVGTLFPSLIRSNSSTKENSGSTIPRHYRNMSVDKFVMSNRLVFRNEDKKTTKFSGINGRFENHTLSQMDVLLMIADLRSKQLGEYGEKWMKATEEHFESIMRIPEYTGQDYDEYADEVMEIIQLMSPDMFLHFGMDSPSTFKNSKWGKRLLGAADLSEYRSCLMSMLIEYRLGRTSQIMDELVAAENAEIDMLETVSQNASRLEDLDAAYEAELETLASSSMVWKAIIEETLDGSSVFRSLIEDKGSYKDSQGSHWMMYGRERTYTDKETGEVKKVGVSFWDRPSEETGKYYSLINFLKSSEPVEVKVAVLADVARVRNGFANMTPEEMLGQLAYHPDRLHAGNRFDMDKGIRSEIDAIKESSERLSSYKSRTPEKIREQADKIIDEARKDANAFERHLQRLADDPGYAVYVDTALAADAIVSVYDKTYDDSEKIKQQALVNGYFGCVSYQRNGGYYTHLYMTDNAVVNMVGADQLTSFDIVRVISDPSIEINVYDEFGTPSKISRRSLCGGDSIEDVINYLDDNPRIALMCRRHIAGVASDVSGTARINAMNDKKYGDSGTSRVFSLLNDRPRFLAVAALITPGNNNVGRNMAESVNENLKKLCQLIAYESQVGGGSPGYIAKDISEKLGISKELFVKLNREGSFDEEDVSEDDVKYASELYDDIIAELEECVGVVQNSGIGLPRYPEPGKFGNPDQSSLIAYYDARQQLSGARTDIMIGVEGSETKKNIVLKEYLRNRPDVYTLDGSGNVIKIADQQDAYPSVADQSLVRDPNLKVNSTSKFLEIKRENGAETFNAKYKKYGDDGSNSMLKFIRMATSRVLSRFGKPGSGSRSMKNGTWSIEDGAGLRNAVASAKSKDDAVAILAQALVDADIRLGYIDLDKSGNISDASFLLSDYYNRADLMIAQNSDGSFVIRTLEQLSAAMRTRLSDEAVASGDPEFVFRELDSIFETLGTDSDPMLLRYGEAEVVDNCLCGVRLHNSIGRTPRVDRALRPRSSSTERNYKLLHNICREFCKDMGITRDVFPSREAIESISIKMYGKLKNADARIADQLKSIAYPKDTWKKVPADVVYETGNPDDTVLQKTEDPHGSREYIYDYLGTFDDADLRIIPGPTNMILFNGDENRVDKARFNSILGCCTSYGITAAFSGSCMNLIPDNMVKDLIQVSEDIWILPCFDMRLNGMFSESIVAAPAEIPADPGNYIVNDEDTTGEFREGDATYHITKELAERIRVRFRGTATYTAERLFPNVARLFPNSDLRLDYCTREEVQKYIVDAEFDPETMTMRGFDDAVVDIGVLPSIGGKENPAFRREAERFRIRLQEYKAMFDYADNDSILECDCRYDSIVGFVKIVIDDQYTVLAPVWPFHLEESGSVPTTFAVERDTDGRSKLELDHSTSSFNMEWAYTGNIEDQYIKAFEGIGASNKLITGPERAQSRQLENGLAIDGFYSTKSVSSRLFPSNKRLATMISAMILTRIDPKHSYNFAFLEDSFPDNPTVTRSDGTVIDVKQGLAEGTLGRTDWKLIKDAGIRYHRDDDINRIVKWWVDKCVDFGTVNPMTLLATRTRKGMLWPKHTEFEAFLDPGFKFQECWMKLMHEMSPKLMPARIDDDASECLFVPVKGDDMGEDYGVLQMRVPHFRDDGTQYTVNENVYISLGFFGSEFSGFKMVNINGSTRTIDDLNVASSLEGDDLVKLLSFARAGMSNVVPASRLEAIPDKVMQKPESIERELSIDNDGIDHVNIYSGGKTKLGKFLSNFAHTPIDTDEGRFESVEGYWHYIGLPEDCPERDQLKKLWGPEARSTGRALRKKYGTVKKDDFRDRIRTVIDIKLEAYREKWENDEHRYMPFEHYYVTRAGNLKDQRKNFGWFTTMLEEEVDKLSTGIFKTGVDPNERILDRARWGKVLALTGHRPNKLWGYDLNKYEYDEVARSLAEYCRENNIDTIVSGMALGFDQLGAQVAIDNGLKFVAAVPFAGQESKWPTKASRDRYNELLGYADMRVIVSDGGYSADKMQIRNEWMVNNADEVFALWDGTSGGTANCVRYAKRKKKKTKILSPKEIGG